MKFLEKNVFLIVIISVLIIECNDSKKIKITTPLAVKGVIDLRSVETNSDLPPRHWDFEKDGSIHLNGEWEFYWNEFLPLDEPIQNSKLNIPNQKYIPIPSQWQQQGYPVDGYATYRLRILLPEVNQDLSLAMTDAGTAYAMYINGKLASTNGKVGKTKEESIPFLQYRTFSLNQFLKITNADNTINPQLLKEFEIRIHVSNFHNYSGGLWDTIKIGSTQKLMDEAKHNFAMDLIVFGSLSIMGLYHLGMYFYRRVDYSSFFFSIYCIIMALRTISINDRIIFDIFYFIPFNLIHKLEYFSFYYGCLVFLQFVKSLYPDEFLKKVFLGFGIVLVPSCFTVIFFPMNLYTSLATMIQIATVLAIFYVFFVLLLANRRNRFGAKLFLTGFMIFASAIVNDILKVRGLLFTPTLSGYGFLTFIFFQSLLLSRRFASGFVQAEKLSSELQTFADTLEKKISEGVKEQQKFSQCLLELSKSKTIEASGLQKSLEEITETCAKILGIEICSVWKYNSKNDELNCLDLFSMQTKLHSSGDIFKTSEYPMYFEYIRDNIVLSVANIEDPPFATEFKEIYQLKVNTKSVLEAPISTGGRLLGIISCEQVEIAKQWTNEEENFVIGISNILASLIEYDERQDAYAALAYTKKEIEDLNQFTHLINSLSNLNEIFIEVSKYAYHNFSIAGTWLFLPDDKKEYLYAYKAYSYLKLQLEQYNYLLTRKVPLVEGEGGVLYLTYCRKKPYFINRIRRIDFPIDKEFVEILSMKSFLHIPLLRKEECVGIFCFSNLGGDMNLSKQDIRKLNNLCSQIAGVIYTNHLLQQVEHSNKEIEKQKKETDDLNNLIKSLNEDLDINMIMKKVHFYIKKNFSINYYGLSVVDKNQEKIISINNQMPEFVNDTDREKINNNSTKENENLGAHAFAFKSKKVIFFPRIRKSAMTKEELFNQEVTKLESILIIPLILENEPIGFLDLYNVGKMKLSKEAITKISILGEQLAGIIYGSNLFKEIQKEKEETEKARSQAEIEKGIALMAQQEAETERQKSERLLLNILPKDIVAELKEKGFADPVLFDCASVMFTDFKGFTQIAEKLTPHELVKDLDACFGQFDKIIERHKLEKLKTIGDSYMCAGGIPNRNSTHAVDCVLAALEIQRFMLMMKELKEMQGLPYWELRLGIHTGSIVAGVIGEKKFAYDVWGDTVNTASRMESSGTPGKINISGATYNLVKDLFNCEFRGMVQAKNKGEVAMYYVNGIKREYAKEEDGYTPDYSFWEMYWGVE